MIGSSAAAASASARAHLSISISRLLDTDVGRIQADVKLDGLRCLLPFTQVATLSTANIKNEKLLAARASRLPRARIVVLVGRVALDDAALDPVVEDAQALDLALAGAPVASPLGHAVVVLSDDIVDASYFARLAGRGGFSGLAIAFELALADGLSLDLGDAGSRSRTLQLSGLLGWGYGASLGRLERVGIVRLRQVVLLVVFSWSLVGSPPRGGVGIGMLAHCEMQMELN